MRVWIDQDLCTGDGLCTDHSPEVFVLADDDGISYVVAPDGLPCNDPGGPADAAPVPAQHGANVIAAAEDCPGKYISSRKTHPASHQRHGGAARHRRTTWTTLARTHRHRRRRLTSHPGLAPSRSTGGMTRDAVTVNSTIASLVALAVLTAAAWQRIDVVVGFVVLGAVFVALEQQLPVHERQPLRRRGQGTDVVHAIADELIAAPLAASVLALGLAATHIVVPDPCTPQ